MNQLALVVMTCAALAVAGCGTTVHPTRGSGTVVSESRNLHGFNAIVIAGVGTARVTQTGAESVVVEAEENLVPLITTTVENGRLRIGLKSGVSISPTRPIVYTITVAKLESADISGSGAIEAGDIKADRFTARISGSGNLAIGHVAATQFTCEVSGSGNVRVAGQADDVDLGISGSGSIRAADLQCRAADVTISGSGSAAVHTTERLTGSISGSGSLQYRGKPSAVETRVSGSGSVSRIAG